MKKELRIGFFIILGYDSADYIVHVATEKEFAGVWSHKVGQLFIGIEDGLAGDIIISEPIGIASE
ncbi:MAG: hypothetical protein PUK70_10330 [Bacteroidales bacterium]|nr:hypothetical protein [Bacteroidales bacterium]MDY6002603.1 hypothetical protein [Candidatus Cryptobacteroides sp.]